jgi:1,4-dihydroxy-2-naphthoate octaprenyltransferase
MFNEYMSMYNSVHDYMPIVVIALALFVVASRIMLRHEMHRMRQLESDIRSERNKLMHERTELERRYHMYM